MSEKEYLSNPVNMREALRRQDAKSRDYLAERVTALNLNNTLVHDITEQQTLSGYAQARHRLHRGLIERLNPQAVANASVEKIRATIEEYLADVTAEENMPLSRIERSKLLDDLQYELMGLGPLSPLMSDATVADILVNGPHQVFVERQGVLELTDVRFHDVDHLMQTIERILSSIGRRVDISSPMVDSRLPDGSRVNVIIPPLSVRGPILSIRRFMSDVLQMKDLIIGGSLTAEAAEFIEKAIHARLNIIISGGTGTGKTTMLNCLARSIPDNQRIITVEDTAELQLRHPHLVSLEARPSNTEGQGTINIRDLVRNTLRMRPDRIIVGEVRGGEALDMLQAMNTGHDGSLATLHSNSPRDTLSRLETMMMMANLELPQRVLREQIGSALNLIVHLYRYADGKRMVSHISEITGLDDGVVLMQDLFITKREGNKLQMRGCNIVPAVSNLMHERGVELDPGWFKS